MCFSPKTNAKQAIKNMTPAHEEWELYDVRRLAFKDITTYGAALKKQKKAMLTSGVDTDDEYEHGIKQSKLKSKQNRTSQKTPVDYCEASKSSEGQWTYFTVVYTMLKTSSVLRKLLMIIYKSSIRYIAI